MKINTEIIMSLNPCKDRLDNWLNHYKHVDLGIKDFLALDKITHNDKLWVVLRLVDPDTRVIFALDCAFAVYASNAAAAAAYADYAAAAYAADYADYAAAAYASNAAAARKEEQDRQIESLLYLIGGES